MKKVSKIITGAAFLGLSVVAASCAKGGSKGGSGAKYNYEFWTGFGSDYTRQVQDIVDEYNAEHTGEVLINHVKKSDYDGLHSAIMNSFGTTTYPNITLGYPDHFADYWGKGILTMLDPYIERYDEESGLKAQGKSIIDDYYSDYMTENKEIAYSDSGEAYTVGVPFNKSTEVLVVNGYYFDYFKAKAQEKGLGEVTIPNTWADLLALAPTLKTIVEEEDLMSTDNNYIIGTVDANDKAITFRKSAIKNPGTGEKILVDISTLSTEKQFYALGYDSPDNAFITILHQWGIPYTEGTVGGGKMNGKAKFWDSTNKANTKTALQYFIDLKKAHGFGVPATFSESLFCTAALEGGRCLFTIGSSGGLNKPDFAQNDQKGLPERRLDIYPILYKDASRKEVISQGTSIGLLNRYVSRETYADEMYNAFKAVVELTTGKLQAEFAASTGYFPASKSAMNHDNYKKAILENPSGHNNILYSKAGIVNRDIYDTQWKKFVDPGFVGSNSIRSKVEPVLQRVMETEGGSAIDTIMNEIWNSIDANLK